MIQPKRELETISAYPKPARFRQKLVRLDHNENDWGCSPWVIEVLRKIKCEDISVYPDQEELETKLAGYHNISPKNILLTTGSDDSIRCVMDTYLERRDKVVIPVPAYSVYPLFCRIRGLDIVEAPYGPEFEFPVQQIMDSDPDEVKMIVIVSPGNPSGTSASREILINILKRFKNSIVLLDEAYSHYCGKTNIDLVSEYENLFVISTFSKAFGLAGLRIGYTASSAGNIHQLEKVAMPYCINSLTIIAAAAALDDTYFVDNTVKKAWIEKEFLIREIKKTGLKTRDTETNFLLAETGWLTNYVFKKLLENRISVRNMDNYYLLNGHIRITVGRHSNNLSLLKSLKKILPLQALLFDMDGVLVNVEDSYRLTIKKTVEFFTKEKVPDEEIQEYKNMGGYNNDWDLTEALILKRNAAVNKAEIIGKFQQLYLGSGNTGFINNESLIIDPEILKEFSGRYKLGIVTGRPAVEAEYTLKRFGIRRYFKSLVALEDTLPGKSKPNPFGINFAKKELKVSRAVYLGDAVDDIIAAEAADVVPAGIIKNRNSNKEQAKLFYASGAAVILENVNQITELL